MAEGQEGAVGKRPRRERSPNYPSISLTEAVSLAQTLWAKEKRTPVSPEVVARAFGYKGLSGPVRQLLATLRQYGLLENDPHGVRLSDLAMEILHQPAGSDERAKALRAAALNPPLIKELATTHGNASDDALRAYLITKRKFADEGVRRFIPAFRDALTLANLGASGYNDPEMLNTPETLSNPAASDLAGVVRQPGGKPRVTQFSWPLSKGITAEVRFVGEEVKPAHLERLRQYLELAKDAVASEEGEAG